MRLLVDTNALLWWFCDASSLSSKANELLAAQDNDIGVSSASLWELSIKHKLGKLPQAEPILTNPAILAHQGFAELAVSWAHAVRAGSLPLMHRDPFDRLLAAQALIEELAVVSPDRALDAYGITRLWR